MARLVKDDWAHRGWIVGNWVYSYLAEGEKPIIITTEADVNRGRTRFEVNHPLYKVFVFYSIG